MYEIDYLAVGAETKTGDAIAMRFTDPSDGERKVVVIDGGFVETGDQLVDHIRHHYGNIVDLVVCTHPDGDHINGLTKVIEQLLVRRLLIHRPANFGYGDDKHNSNSKAVEALVSLARSQSVEIDDTSFTGTTFFGGALAILGPTEEFYREQLELQSKLATSTLARAAEASSTFAHGILSGLRKLISDPGEETPLTDNSGTSARNNTSIILDLLIDGKRIMFTGDAGAPALEAAADQIDVMARSAIPISLFDIPHHGSRHNLTSQLLDRLLGAVTSEIRGQAIASVGAKANKHPRWEVANAIKRRGYPVYRTAGINLWNHTTDAPARSNYTGLVEEVGWVDDPDA